MPGGRRGEVTGGGRRGTRLNLEGLGVAVKRFVTEGGEVGGDESGTSSSLSFPFVLGTGTSLGRDSCTVSGNATLALAGEGNPELAEEPLAVGGEGGPLEGGRSRLKLDEWDTGGGETFGAK